MKIFFLSFLTVLIIVACSKPAKLQSYSGGDCNIEYVGRGEYTSDSLGVRQWASGAYFSFAFEGNECTLMIINEILYSGSFNYLELVLDDKESRIKVDSAINTISLDSLIDTSRNRHTLLVCRDTESSHGYTQLAEVTTRNLQAWSPTDIEAPLIEFIGNSITCGAEAYCDEVPYGTGNWGDRHRAYFAYGPRAARMMNAKWMLTSVSGIGLIRSCCDMDICMPMVYDKIDLRDNDIDYNFAIKPQTICICLGQNDGIQDSTAFCSAYVDFIGMVREKNPESRIVMLTSPMADDTLRSWLMKMILSVESATEGTEHYFFTRQWKNGGGDHPDCQEHEQIALELVAYLNRNQ
ncbi:MAG: acetyl xylan esterase [Marinilabiliaceae bacterium]|nr:acetyl xylan esterase [Marinilabiliaceae bacterium]